MNLGAQNYNLFLNGDFICSTLLKIAIKGILRKIIVL
jgi:hypothetical protein